MKNGVLCQAKGLVWFQNGICQSIGEALWSQFNVVNQAILIHFLGIIEIWEMSLIFLYVPSGD